MVETQPTYTTEKKSARQRIFQLTSTKARVGIGEESQKKHPCFSVLLNSDNPRWVNNLQMSQVSYDAVSKTVTIAIEEFNIPGSRRLAIEDVKLENNVLLIGKDGKIACRNVSQTGVIVFYMSMACNIRVYSEKGREQVTS